MKKLVSLTLALLLALSVLLLPAMAEEAPTIKLGKLTVLNGSEEDMLDYQLFRFLIARQMNREGLFIPETDLTTVNGQNSDNEPEWIPNFEITYFDTLDAMLMALNAGNIQFMEVYDSTARYLVNNNPELVQTEAYSDETEGNAFAEYMLNGPLCNDFAFMFMEDNEALRDEFDAALASITEAEMDQLYKNNITAAINGDEVKPVQMPVIDGAETIKVAVTGALPPMDYVAPDGTPAGFNTALLAEISQRIGKNIELVTVDSVGRAAALASGTVDAVFWTRTNSLSNAVAVICEEMSEQDQLEQFLERRKQDWSDEEYETVKEVLELMPVFPKLGHADMPEGTIITEPYFSDTIVPVTTRAHMDEVKAAEANN